MSIEVCDIPSPPLNTPRDSEACNNENIAHAEVTYHDNLPNKENVEDLPKSEFNLPDLETYNKGNNKHAFSLPLPSNENGNLLAFINSCLFP